MSSLPDSTLNFIVHEYKSLENYNLRVVWLSAALLHQLVKYVQFITYISEYLYYNYISISVN